MTDRQDIDALLIGSLYGELSSTEEARLAAHLESHPQDRTALADLSWARDAVRESRILSVQLEPPQSISALLLQEAHRRAPKAKAEEGERSWFQRFMRSFMLHPAMAAAAMLVLIIGVAGTLYVRKGDHFANQMKDPQGEAPSIERTGEQAPTASTPPSNDELLNARGSAAQPTEAADNFAVKLDEDGAGAERQRNAEAKPAEPLADKNKGKSTDLGFEGKLAKDTKEEKKAREAEDRSVASKPAAKKPASKGYIEVTTPDQAPKDFEQPKTTTASRSEGDETTAGRTTVAGGAGMTARPGSVQPQPPPPATPAAPEAVKQEAKPDPKPADPMLAWAQKQHGAVVAQVKAGKCDAAATLALQIANRAPAYYSANVEDDIAIKKCKAYIAQQREQEAERVQRAKATQRRADEPAKAAPAKSK